MYLPSRVTAAHWSLVTDSGTDVNRHARSSCKVAARCGFQSRMAGQHRVPLFAIMLDVEGGRPALQGSHSSSTGVDNGGCARVRRGKACQSHRLVTIHFGIQQRISTTNWGSTVTYDTNLVRLSTNVGTAHWYTAQKVVRVTFGSFDVIIGRGASSYHSTSRGTVAPRWANGGAGPLSDPLGRSLGTAFIVCNIAAFRARCRSMLGSDQVWCIILLLKGAISLVSRSESCVGGRGSGVRIRVASMVV